MDRFLVMNCFVRAVETGSFSAVARELGTSQPSVSRYVALLEDHLGTRLLHRSTRKLNLTPEGERYYGEVRRILDAVTEAESNARGEGKPKGQLRIACATSIGRAHILPRVQAFLERYPELSVDLHINDRYVDLVEEGLDLAIRIGPLKDSALRARPIGISERVCAASPEYLARHGTPRHPVDLLKHNCITYSLSPSGSSWAFRSGEITVNGRFRVNTPDGIVGSVLGGFGVGYAPLWMFEEALASGKVQLVLAEFMGPPVPINIVYSARRLLPRRASVFMDFIAEEFRRLPILQEGALARVVSASRPRSRGGQSPKGSRQTRTQKPSRT